MVSFMFLSSFIFPASQGVEPTEPMDMGSKTFETSWHLNESSSYESSNVEFKNGKVTLGSQNYLWNQTSDDDFEEGTLNDSLVITHPLTSTIIYEDDFDDFSGPGEWDEGEIDGPPEEEWEKFDVSFLPAFIGSSPSGGNVWGTKVGIYTDSDGEPRDYYLRSPNIDLSKYKGTKLTLSFSHHYIFDNATNGNDGGIVEVSVDNGDSWDLIFPKGGYSSTIDDPINPLFGIEQNKFFGGNSPGWTTDEFILTAFDEETNFSFRFRFATNGSESDYGWYVDDIIITSTTVSEGEIELVFMPIEGGNNPDNLFQRQAGITIIDLENPIDSDGALTQWSVHVTQNGTGRMKIFRQVGDEFVFVGQTDPEDVSIFSDENNFDCEIEVKAGDFIGWYSGDSTIYSKEESQFDSYFTTGDIKDTSPITDWTLTDHHHSIYASGIFREPIGVFESKVFNALSPAKWGNIYWVERLPNNDVDIEFRTRSGNVKDPTQGWNPWSSWISTSSGINITSDDSRYIQFEARLTSNKQPYTPVLDDIFISYTKYNPSGSLETRDFSPENIVQWLDFTPLETETGQTIEYSYSLDSGNTWTSVPDEGDLREVSVLEGKIRFRMDFSTTDTTVSPELDEMTLSYSSAQPLMNIRMEVDKKQAVSQEEITFEIFYTNTGIGDAKDVRIELFLDANLSYESDDSSDNSFVDEANNKIIWQYETVSQTGAGEKRIRVVTQVKNIEDETSFDVQAILNYTDSGDNDYPVISSNSIKIDVGPALDVFVVLLVGIFLAVTLIFIMVTVTRRVLREEPEDRIAMQDIGSGIGYLVIEDNPKKSYGVFSELIDSGKQGLCITRTFPGRVMSNYSFDDISLLWLSRAKDQNSILPTNLGGILQSVKDFVEESDDPVVLLDGLEYLMVHNDFQRVLKLVHGMNELVAINDARLIIPFNPQTMEEDKVALLKRDLKIINLEQED
jgi:hypothetical protein